MLGVIFVFWIIFVTCMMTHTYCYCSTWNSFIQSRSTYPTLQALLLTSPSTLPSLTSGNHFSFLASVVFPFPECLNIEVIQYVNLVVHINTETRDVRDPLRRGYRQADLQKNRTVNILRRSFRNNDFKATLLPCLDCLASPPEASGTRAGKQH